MYERMLNKQVVPTIEDMVAYCGENAKWFHTLTAGIIMSLLIEVMQLYTFRASDIDDLLMNTLGTVVGFGVAKLFLRHRKMVDEDNKEWLKLFAINSIVLLVIIFIRYPMMACIYSLIWLD